jgi:hypothetical protein
MLLMANNLYHWLLVFFVYASSINQNPIRSFGLSWTKSAATPWGLPFYWVSNLCGILPDTSIVTISIPFVVLVLILMSPFLVEPMQWLMNTNKYSQHM